MNAIAEPGTSAGHPIDNEVSGPFVGHVRSYLDSGGDEPRLPAPLLLITTRGRRSGLWHRTAVFFTEHDGAIVLFGSNMAGAEHPHWYSNAVEHPAVVAQIGRVVTPMTARVAAAEERPPLWAALTTAFPPYAEHQAAVDREIGILVLEAADR